MNDFIYCREYGLQPALPGINFGISEANGNPPVIINQAVQKTKTVTKGTLELIQVERVLYKKLITLSGFNGYNHLYVGKRTNLYFQNVAFDFTNDKWRIRELAGSNLNNIKFNVYDRPKIKSILGQFLTRNVDEVFTLMYTTIATASGLEKFLSILEVVIEYKDEFFNLLKPYEVAYIDPYSDPKLTNNNGKGTYTGIEPNNAPATNNPNNTVYYISGTLLALWLVKRIRNKKNR